jgi:hypothetical protein
MESLDGISCATVGETAKEYVRLKNALFRKRAIATREVERIKYLIRGLRSSQVKAAVLAMTPAVVNEIVEMVQPKESLITDPFSTGVLAALFPTPPHSEISELADQVKDLAKPVAQMAGSRTKCVFTCQ